VRGIRIPEARGARRLRRAQTFAEARLWSRLRNRGLAGHKFVRQEPIGPYFADFVCRERGLVVEVDGATHSTEEELRRDGRRTRFLEAQGFRVMRVLNDHVVHELEGVLETVLDALRQPPASPQPSPGKRERD
jgi:very-short-patch-repair endonuclease